MRRNGRPGLTETTQCLCRIQSPQKLECAGKKEKKWKAKTWAKAGKTTRGIGERASKVGGDPRKLSAQNETE